MIFQAVLRISEGKSSIYLGNPRNPRNPRVLISAIYGNFIIAEISTREKPYQQGIYKANKQIVFKLLDVSPPGEPVISCKFSALIQPQISGLSYNPLLKGSSRPFVRKRNLQVSLRFLRNKRSSSLSKLFD